MWNKNKKLYILLSVIINVSFIMSFLYQSKISLIYANSISNLSVGEEIKIGKVIASDEKLKWKIYDIDEENNKIFVITKDIIDVREFGEGICNYKNSKIRYYLNNEFLNKNFTEDEKEHILYTENESNMAYLGGDEFVGTVDKIFLLSMDEIVKYNIESKDFKSNSYVKELFGADIDGNFWLRDVHYDLQTVCCMSKESMPNKGKSQVGVENFRDNGVVCAMWYSFDKILSDYSDDNFLYDRIGGKKEKVEFADYEIEEAREFNFNEYSFYGFHKVAFGQMVVDNIVNDLKWNIVSDDGKKLLLFSENILEYKEIEYDDDYREYKNEDLYNHTNIKKYLNEDLYNRIFDDDEKNAIEKIGDEYMTIPCKNDLFKYSFIDENVSKKEKKILDKYIYNLFSLMNSQELTYFIKDIYEFEGEPYLMSVYLGDNYNDISFFVDRYLDNTFINSKKALVSGIRPMIKVDREKFFASYENNMMAEPTVDFMEKVKFGKYEQDGNLENGKEDIYWTVVKRREEYNLLLSDKIIDAIDISKEMAVTDYYNSNLFAFSNNTFLNEAFNEKEKEKLKVVMTHSVNIKGYEYEDKYHRGKYNANIDKDIKTGYDKVFSLNLKYGLEKTNMYKDILNTEITEYVKNQYGDIDCYLKQDLYDNYYSENYVKNKTHYMLLDKNGNYIEDTTYKKLVGFRPMICISNSDLRKIKNNK